MKNKGSDEDCFSELLISDRRNLLKLELTEGDSLEVSDDTPMCNPHRLPLINLESNFIDLF